ncbi:MAG: TraR/DksA C4-type zinc finger protein [Bacteroidetes bacterium]|nr:TraR/DksA C4-type zinc finger protein [Bacteroidota bacterium]
MTPEDKKLVTEKIDSKIARTKKHIEEYKELTKPIAPENAIGRLSRMEAINSKSVAEAALREAEATLKNLEHMKAHLDDSNFGKCATCKKDIPVQRLIIRPSSRHCVECAR